VSRTPFLCQDTESHTLRTSVPRRTPPSMMMGTCLPMAATMCGSISSAVGAKSHCRPPWLETITPSTPASTASFASNGDRMPCGREESIS
jgi:hypothetical protein